MAASRSKPRLTHSPVARTDDEPRTRATTPTDHPDAPPARHVPEVDPAHLPGTQGQAVPVSMAAAAVSPPVRSAAGSEVAVTPLARRVRILVDRRGRDGGPTVTSSGLWWSRHRIVWIDGSQGVVVGDGNRQQNTTELRVTDALVHLDDATCGLATMRRFTALAADPTDARRQASLRRQLLADNHRRHRDPARPHLADDGAMDLSVAADRIVVTRSSGVIVGDRNFQVNDFAYRWRSPEFGFADLVAANPKLITRLSDAMARPDDDGRMTALVTDICDAVSAIAPAYYLE